ncbi:MAG TPA: hypothetical protein VKX96_06765 [Chloroflexota bacterium]|jgi:hypothetical protein|nr:hypothetical protein [Chloroflexota bacterium]
MRYHVFMLPGETGPRRTSRRNDLIPATKTEGKPMAQELGKIERPTAASFEGTRKLFLVPLVYSPSEPPADYVGMLERYWAGVRNQVRRLTERTGPIRHVYHEGVFQIGEEGRQTIERLNIRSHTLIHEVCDSEAVVEALEDGEVFAESIDWQRCLMAGLASHKVLDLAWNGYREATRRRFEVMSERIEQTLKPGEAGLLLIREEHSIQFPKDVQVFYIAPPALDEIHRWLREREQRERQQATNSEAGQQATTG